MRSTPLTSLECTILEEIAYNYFMIQYYLEAKIIYAGLVEIAPQVSSHQLGLGLSSHRLGLSGAETALLAASEADPTDALPWLNLAEIIPLSVNSDKRRYYLKQALARLTPSDTLYLKATHLLQHRSSLNPFVPT